ncbi:MAG: MOSC domain-containing protein [Polyangiaceae bacterium]
MSVPVIGAPSVAHPIKITSITVYPVKSCRGIPMQRARVTRRGLERDRRWMIVDDRGRFITQRTDPAMCLIHTELAQDHIVLSHEKHGRCEIPIELSDGNAREVEVWRFRGKALAHLASERWISEVIQRPASLVFMPDDVEREVNQERGKPGDIVSFADAYPVLLTSTGSLDDLNRRLDFAVEMERFRPNVVIDEPEPFAEDNWPHIKLGALGFRNVKPCDRCVMTTVDPRTGNTGKEPLKTLATFRAKQGAVYFGVNLIPDQLGELSVGDIVQPTLAT